MPTPKAAAKGNPESGLIVGGLQSPSLQGKPPPQLVLLVRHTGSAARFLCTSFVA